ncbi:endoribonuclease L-PSP [Kwoniella heveanensis CBS 569]|nr:endoribonuclease L-PSP [Kwoniella heveanensis CBS 569]
MSELQYFNYKGYGEWAAENTGYAQAVRVGDVLHLSGQGGWKMDSGTPEFVFPIEKQIEQAFENVEAALKAAGGKGWSQVFRVTTYFTVDITPELNAFVARCFKRWMPDHQPLWTLLGVRQLGEKDMHVEVEVQAYAPLSPSSAN